MVKFLVFVIFFLLFIEGKMGNIFNVCILILSPIHLKENNNKMGLKLVISMVYMGFLNGKVLSNVFFAIHLRENNKEMGSKLVI